MNKFIIDGSNVNVFLNKYISFTERVSTKYNYDVNIKHVLYLIVPAFVLKYGIDDEKKILNCFENIPIHVSGITDLNTTAYFRRRVLYDNDKYYTVKEVVLNNYDNISLLELIDNIVHEFNHAVNSIINEVSWDNENVIIRTGISHVYYSKDDITKFIKKSKDVTLEEIINTKQTEDIINIINSFNKYKIDNNEFSNMLYALRHDIGNEEYVSNAYYLQSFICKELMKNKTFIPTIETLRFKGNVSDISSWFDSITGIEGSYNRLITLLDDILCGEQELTKVKWFKKLKLNKLISKGREVLDIVKLFDNNCIYK